MDYKEFIKSKTSTSIDMGIDVSFTPINMFDFQKHVLKRAVNKGRMAVFLDTGLGKTLIELAVAQNYYNYSKKPVLIITPLAVAFQFIEEAKKFGIDSVSYSKDGTVSSNIVVCNYERLNKFNPDNFDCVILDESSILKNFKGAIKNDINIFLRKVKYRFLFTATPSPNDFIELGTSSEALGYMGYMDMLSTFFTNNEDSISPNKIGVKWVLKSHAREDFFKWVSTWSMSMRKPSDLGFSDDKFKLPALIVNNNLVHNENPLVINNQMGMFALPATRLQEVRAEQSATIDVRCKKAVNLASNYDVSVYWCNLNAEADLVSDLDQNSVQIKGSMKLEQKEDILLKFSRGEIKKLITKSKITAFGLNWQHCNHTVYFPTFSYEQYYQSIRRFWRFGQTKDVTVDLVYSDGMDRIIESLKAKAEKANELFSKLNKTLNSSYSEHKEEFNKKIILPNFLQK